MKQSNIYVNDGDHFKVKEVRDFNSQIKARYLQRRTFLPLNVIDKINSIVIHSTRMKIFDQDQHCKFKYLYCFYKHIYTYTYAWCFRKEFIYGYSKSLLLS